MSQRDPGLQCHRKLDRDTLRNKGTMKDFKGRWSTLVKDVKQKYCQEAAALGAHGQAQDLSPEMRGLRIKMHLKKLKLEAISIKYSHTEEIVKGSYHPLKQNSYWLG
ncbi:hypothetical protein G5714_010598 [Onychostoma macrolepis]|uniref:Uncharacterized protein n=1 Tax=Onychostoma macrolepis TaxID=369639 RepID=A0A7J6CKJ8_9TELE|nr:hypothetical protein G5714_010598 [Onychostoma macrolepis]